MAQKKKIGVFVLSPTQWTGGYYYSLNLIKCAHYLPEAAKPHLIVFYSDATPLEEIKSLRYPYIDYLPLKKEPSFFEKLKYKLGKAIFRVDFPIFLYKEDTVSFLYPCEPGVIENQVSIALLKKIYWIPDFQEKHLPDFFAAEELQARDNNARSVSKLENTLAFSSQSVLEDYKVFYPQSKNRIKILRFASILPSLEKKKDSEVKDTYGVDQPYFISPNQFWVHKNHRVVLEAALILHKKGLKFLLLFTGKEFDYRYPTYTEELKAFVIEHQLSSCVKFLGFIDREDQLVLMKNSIAIIQPSLFEGWSTVVEDTKAINHRILLSDLPVHREQMTQNVAFFDPRNAGALAELMEDQIHTPLPIHSFDYRENIKAFAQDFMALDSL
jgi:glycosyltransferase involved in cell wall biosynthesis